MTDPRVPARVDRATALTIAARIHTGRGTSPYRLVQDAEVIADYLRTGDVIEDPQLAELREKFEGSKGGAITTLDVTFKPEDMVSAIRSAVTPKPWRPELGEITIRPRWWRRRPLDPVAVIGLTSYSIGIAAGLTLLAYLVTR